ncbi:methylase [Mycobacterium sp. Root265]|uniref:HemK2/MTQ2 family protein methyltransferase n=1 Tax=Mycobacterium sp. Root265 TaxID=1736504 RepID=UPI00070B8B63|nr:HemK2/MTQ2 family protein methyltransferase [Mycobacterium sp. Root265]KRD15379.1 methylase [Mycobacterium sp. Root265]
MRTTFTRTASELATVYRPQQDSYLLVQALQEAAAVAGRRVLDLCSGSGVVAMAAAGLGAKSVTGFDICPRAVQYARTRASVAGADVHIRLGSWTQALECAPFDVVACNPPGVPMQPDGRGATPGAWGAPSTPWNGGPDGRLILDPLCQVAAGMLAARGVLLLVQSELSDIDRSLEQLRGSGLDARIVLTEQVRFGPVLSEQAGWLEQTGRLDTGRREEQIAVIRADKPA